MSGKASIDILNPLNPLIRAASINVNFTTTFTLDIEPTGNIINAVASNIDLDV